MAVKQVAIRLKPEGGAEVTQAFKSAEAAGVQAADATIRATDRATAAAQRQEAQWERNREAYIRAANAADAQARFNAALGVDRPGSSASASADVFAAAFRAEEESARKAMALRAQIDPAGAALDRLNGELREYEMLAKRGAISSTELARAQQLARTRYDEATAALNRNTGGLSRNQVASRLNLTRQAADVVVTAGMGMSPGMIALQQGPQILDAIATSGLKARSAMLLLGGGLGLAAAAAGTAFVAWKAAEDGALALERAATGLGRTSGVTAAELEALALAGAEQGEISTRAARDQAAAWASTGKISGEVIGGLLAMSKDYAAFMGLDAAQATEALARSFAEPDKAARELTRQFGLMDQAALDTIDSLVKQGDRLGAQKLLLEELTEAVSGHADRVGEIESAWDAVARAAANAFDWIGRALHTTRDERIAQLERRLDSPGFDIDAPFRTPGFRREEEAELARLRAERDAEAAREAAISREAQANQAAQEAKDRAARTRRPRSDRSAEREARRRLQFDRQEEDRAAEIALAEAQAFRDTDRVRTLEDEAQLRQRIRQLVDDGVAAEEARTRAMAEQSRLLGARAIEQGRQQSEISRAAAFEVDRELGLQRTVQLEENRLELLGRINDYVEAGRGYYAAWLAASRDQLEVEQARETVMARQVAIAEREHRLNLARLSGREGVARWLEIEQRIEARAREIERRGRDGKPLDYGEGVDQAQSEIQAELDAEAQGVRRKWMRDFVADIRSGGIREALASQFESAVDRLINRLIDSLFEIDWAAAMGGGKGKGGGGGGWLGSLIGSAADLLFGGIGRNANGTDNWRGGWSWVGEEGPELAWLPKGSKVASHPQSMRMMAQAAAPAQVVDARTFHFTGNLMTPEFWAQIEAGDRMAARTGARQGATAAVGFVQGTASEVQRGDRMLKN